MVTSAFLLISGCLILTPGIDTTTAQPVKYPQWGLMLKAFGIIAFLFDIHPSVLTILVDMDDKKKLPVVLLGGFGGKYNSFVQLLWKRCFVFSYFKYVWSCVGVVVFEIWRHDST